MNEESTKVVLDGDGYIIKLIDSSSVTTDNERIMDALLAAHLDPDLFQLYYLATRSSVQFIGENDKIILERIAEWRQVALGAAGALVKIHRKKGQPVEPPWFRHCQTQILEALEPQYPDLREVKLVPTLDPRISARAKSNNTISISVFAREILRTFNIVTYETIVPEISEMEAGQPLDAEGLKNALSRQTEVSQNIRVMLPYWIFCNDFIHAANIPTIGASSIEILKHAHETARIQMLFVLLHEYAHIALGHCGQTGLTQDQRIAYEKEADEFAIAHLSKVLSTDPWGDDDELWVAARWLFRYQFLDYRVGQLLRGSIDDNSMLEARRTSMFEAANRLSLTNTFTAERGVAILMLVERKLIEQGPSFLKSVANQLSESMENYSKHSTRTDGPNVGNPDWFNPWWEEIK